MTSTNPTVLVLAGSGKVGRRVAQRLTKQGVPTRAAARSGTDTRFDWDQPTTYGPALSDVGRVFLVPPANSISFADQVEEFLSVAEASGVGHVTYLSARGVDAAPPEVALRSVELQLQAQSSMSHTILRPAWFMQNFTESFLLPGITEQDLVVAPAGDGAEAFISADDVAAVAVASLVEPHHHAGNAYTLTGPAPLTFSAAAETISANTGRNIAYLDIGRQQWLDATVAAGVPQDYATMLLGLFDVIRSGAGATTTPTVHEILGRSPMSFADFAATGRETWRHV